MKKASKVSNFKTKVLRFQHQNLNKGQNYEVISKMNLMRYVLIKKTKQNDFDKTMKVLTIVYILVVETQFSLIILQ